MQATFLSHSAFLVETDSALLLFDWQNGALPSLPAEKPLTVFVSHGHEDHFHPRIFSLDDGSRPVRFLLGKDLRLTPRRCEKWNLSPETAGKCQCLGGGETAQPFPGILVETLPSTDEGVAFVVTVDGFTLYHAGDLNWWHWEGEDHAWNRNMEVNFKRFLEPLRGRTIDLAMVPLDPRQESAAGWGLKYFLELVNVRHVLPMHQWGDFELTHRFLAEFPAFSRQVIPVERENQCFTFS